MNNLNNSYTTVFPKSSGQPIEAADFGGATGVLTKVYDALNIPGAYRDTSVTAATYTVDPRDVNIFCDNSASDMTVTMYQISNVGTATSPKRSHIFVNRTARKVTINPGTGQKLVNPYTQVSTSAGVGITLLYAPGDVFELYPVSSDTWIVSILRENNDFFYARHSLSANVANTFGTQLLTLGTVQTDVSGSISGGVYIPKVPGVYHATGNIVFGPYTVNTTQYVQLRIRYNNADFAHSGLFTLNNLSANANTQDVTTGGIVRVSTLSSIQMVKDSTNANSDGNIQQGVNTTWCSYVLLNRYIP